jgi:Tfp pilus assembly protein PilV
MHRTQLQSAGFRTRGSGLRGSRRGISVIEVLTSILVAAIGVAGVMVIIPFAVGQAEQGFDQETATTFGRNFADEFEIRGFDQAARWVPSSPLTDLGNGIVVDPIGTSATTPTTLFPYMLLADQPAALSIPRVNLKNEQNVAFSAALGRTLFSWRNDLVFGQPDAVNTAAAYPSPDLAPPEMFYDFSGSTPVRRQFEGEMSCVVFCVPDRLIPDSLGNPYAPAWRSHIVVYRRRPLPTPNAPFPFDRAYTVTPTISSTPPQRILVSGGEALLTATTTTATSQHSAIRRGDWMLVTNRLSAPAVRQLNFYRVLDASEQSPGNWQVTLQGPDFDLLNNLASPPVTYAVHLPDVWAVIERTYERN